MSESNVAPVRPLSKFFRMAVVAGVESAVQVHVDRGDDVSARDASGMTPLMLAAARNKPTICKLLLTAGADRGLLDPSGKTALEIAIAAGSQAAAAILIASCTPIPPSPQGEIAFNPEQKSGAEPAAGPGPHAAECSAGEPEGSSVPLGPIDLVDPPKLESALLPDSTAVVDESDYREFDLSGWEAEGEPTRPEADLAVLQSATAIQDAITSHDPTDSSVEWDDIDAYLPEVALPLGHADDAERRALLRRLLLRAIREGSVPSLDVERQSTNEDGSANPEAEAYLAMVINDLGAEVDERTEYSDAAAYFELLVAPEETPDEEAVLDEAQSAIDRAASPRFVPLRIYQREVQHLRLLTAEEEVQLAKDMEAGLDAALDALSAWPEGIALTLAAGAEASAGSRSLSAIWVGNAEPDPEPPLAESLEADATAAEDPEDPFDDDGEPADLASADVSDASFTDALRRLASLIEADDAPKPSHRDIRQALVGLRLNRHFLLELVDAADGVAPCPAFARAMTGFREARDRMAAANLKLAFFHARKHQYSGEPLDDLAQEGNLGLLKAVDRYDWRRGFRFSTYATWWIRQQIGRHVADRARTIRVPVHIHEKAHRAARETKAFETTFSRQPTMDELAERMEMPPHKLAALLSIAPEPSCIDELPIDDMIAIEARDTFTSPDPADVVDELLLRAAVDRFVSSLATRDGKQEQVLRLRFGIGVDDAYTLEEIGLRFGVTRERIRQIEAKATRKLKHPTRAEPFARQALGLAPGHNLIASRVEEPDTTDGPDADEA